MPLTQRTLFTRTWGEVMQGIPSDVLPRDLVQLRRHWQSNGILEEREAIWACRWYVLERVISGRCFTSYLVSLRALRKAVGRERVHVFAYPISHIGGRFLLHYIGGTSIQVD